MDSGKAQRYHVRRREFLNQDLELPAFVIAVIQDTTDLPDDEDQRWKWAQAILDLGDCYKRVSFDLNMSDLEERAKTLHKINLLAEVINEVRDAIEKEVESRNARPHVQDHSQAAVA